ncbi:MAG: ferrochelatase [Sandaracinaceae bacterium]
MAEPLAVVDARSILRQADRSLDGIVRRSLAPSRERATSLSGLGAALLGSRDEEHDVTLARGLARIAAATRRCFPDNVFWDLDALATALSRLETDELREAIDELEELYALFGVGGPIRFRYAHDFVYGFDWARWVARDPEAHAAIGPFDRRFFRTMLARGGELLELIEADDAKYPRLREGELRNPFGYARDPASERLLYERLAREGGIPVHAWSMDPEPRWDGDFEERRTACARELAEARASSSPP